MSNNILNAAFVSCDIVGHGKVHDHEIQKNRIQKINDIIEKVCRGHFGKGIVWASGGDGGHVAFFHESMRGMTIRLIKDLFQWADESSKGGDSDLKLRLTAHFGPVSTIVGADKRDQLVGNGINFCGSLLSFGAPGSVIVSSDFKNFVNRGRRQNDELVDRTRFHDEHSVYIKHFQIHRISFMSIDGEFESKRRSPEKSDQIHLDEARKDKEGEINLAWQIIYHAKRLLQIDSSNDKAKMAIRAILPNRLHFKQFIVRNDFMEEIVNQSHPLFWRSFSSSYSVQEHLQADVWPLPDLSYMKVVCRWL